MGTMILLPLICHLRLLWLQVVCSPKPWPAPVLPLSGSSRVSSDCSGRCISSGSRERRICTVSTGERRLVMSPNHAPQQWPSFLRHYDNFLRSGCLGWSQRLLAPMPLTQGVGVELKDSLPVAGCHSSLWTFCSSNNGVRIYHPKRPAHAVPNC